MNYISTALIAVAAGNTSGIMVRKGTAVTVVLWFAAIAAHVALSIGVPVVFGEGVGHGLSGLDGATLLIYLAVSLGVQGLIAKSRVAAADRSGSTHRSPRDAICSRTASGAR